MKKLCFVLVFAMMISTTVFVFADSPKNDNGKKIQVEKKVKKEVKQEKQELKKEAKQEKQELKAKKVQLNKQKNQIQADLKAAFDSGNEEVVAKLKTQLKSNIQERKQLVLEKYTAEELETIKEAIEKIKEIDSKVKVLDVDSILSDSKEFKFDTPPVIKGNRTLIPVRAITEGLGAEVGWDKETQEVTITKDQTTIVLTLGNNVALVNGEEVQLDTKANTMNNRTYVPMRFIMETFGMKVTYDDGTIEVEEQVEDTTTDGAIEIPADSTTTDGAIEVN